MGRWERTVGKEMISLTVRFVDGEEDAHFNVLGREKVAQLLNRIAKYRQWPLKEVTRSEPVHQPQVIKPEITKPKRCITRGSRGCGILSDVVPTQEHILDKMIELEKKARQRKARGNVILEKEKVSRAIDQPEVQPVSDVPHVVTYQWVPTWALCDPYS